MPDMFDAVFINDIKYTDLRTGMAVLVNGQVREISGYYLSDTGYTVTYYGGTHSEH